MLVHRCPHASLPLSTVASTVKQATWVVPVPETFSQQQEKNHLVLLTKKRDHDYIDFGNHFRALLITKNKKGV
ncbi:MAG: hypothetical protein A4E57_01949 [Syntrophorhabdaceae bacterium PtaU1.Bin034]|nr:MAG: hypothetical protein A4E57_01949 [Syntrophorhabdaceae bacterium PtaU1.Bin034]